MADGARGCGAYFALIPRLNSPLGVAAVQLLPNSIRFVIENPRLVVVGLLQRLQLLGRGWCACRVTIIFGAFGRGSSRLR